VNAYLVCNTNIDGWNSRMMRVGGPRTSFAGRLWRIAVLATAGALGSASQAAAALYYWSDFDPGYYRPGPIIPQQRPKARHRQAKKIVVPEKESAKPQGPLIISISIDRQTLRIYDANGFFAETPISTGMKGHPTPMGVFSVIQKHKLHHSNIYSNAPMPFMQRITWSGVAIHAGVLPGYPASHGCIRMPMAFAVKMWNWTKMGARVVVTPGEMTPSSFSHPLLATHKVVPQPAAANAPQTDAPPAAKADKAADTAVTTKPVMSEAGLELRSTVGHDDNAKPAATPLRDQTHTADASSDLAATKAPVTMTDAAPSSGKTPPREEPAATTDSAPGDIAATDNKPGETKSSENPTAEIRSAETGAADEAGKNPDEAEIPAQASVDAVSTEAPATEAIKAEAKADDVKLESLKPDAAKTAEKPDDTAKTVTDVGASVPVQRDQARVPDTEKAAASKPEPATTAAPKRSGQIAAFISRKDSKLYVRQNFAPLFEVPVMIAPSDRPLGTHVFTVQVEKNDANVLHWSVVSLPAPSRYAERREENERALRKRKIAGAVEIKPSPVPDSPAEALDRLTIPADAMARITEALSTGGSIIVSDQGINAGETGEGTDFIVSLR
jgi:lipoprotein-anchoring transpeptidase ErfK/SrfK